MLRKALGKVQYTFSTKILSKLDIYLLPTKGYQQKPPHKIILNAERMMFSLQNQQGSVLLPLLFSIMLEALTNILRQEKEKKVTHFVRKEITVFIFFLGNNIIV